MRLNIKIDANYEEPEALITTAHMTEEVSRIADYISGTEDTTTIISGTEDGEVNLLAQEDITRIYAEDGKVFAKTERSLYQLRLRLYELEERLDNGIYSYVLCTERCRY